MIDGKEVAAIVPVRGGSVRVPGKNMRLLGGETLLGRKVRQLKECSLVDRVVVGSDDDRMLEEAARLGAETVRRRETDERVSTANDMVREMMELVSTGVVLWAHCTNPLVSPATYDRALECLGRDGCDSVVSVHKVQEHLWHPDRRTPCYNVAWCRNYRHIPASGMPAYWMQDGAIFIQPYARMKAVPYFFGERPYLFEVPEEEFLDVNTEYDLELAQWRLDNAERLASLMHWEE